VKFADDLNKTILELKAAHQELQEAYLDTIHRLVLAAEYKDEDIVSIKKYIKHHKSESQIIIYKPK
jgi:putative two-component system response regulator